MDSRGNFNPAAHFFNKLFTLFRGLLADLQVLNALTALAQAAIGNLQRSTYLLGNV